MPRTPEQIATDLRSLADEVALLELPDEPPPPPPPTRAGLYTDGTKLRTRHGAELRLRCVELMVNGNAAGFPGGFLALLGKLKADVGANATSPLLQGTQGSVAQVKAYCDASLSLGMVVGVNADHQDAGRDWLLQPAMVALLKTYPHVYLVSEVETYGDGDWQTAESAKVAALRAAGYTCPIKAGTHGGGRDVKYPLAAAPAVLAADPLHNVVFTWQAYWKAATGGWQYSEANGFVAGIVGTRAALSACVNKGVCFIPGFDHSDNVGNTGSLVSPSGPTLVDHAGAIGMSTAWWAATGDGARPVNNLYDWDFGADGSPANATRVALSAAWKAQRAAFPDTLEF